MTNLLLNHLPRWTGTSSPTAPWTGTQARGMCHGLMCRTSASARNAAILEQIRSYVVEVEWGEAQLTAGGAITAAVEDYLGAENDYALANGLKIRLRLYAGIHAPGFAKSVGGFVPMDWMSRNQNTGVVFSVGTMGPFWQAAYAALYDDLLSKLAAILSPLTAFAEITNGAMMTRYAEPMIHEWAHQDPDMIVARGYTFDEEMATWTLVNQSHVDHISPIGMATTLSANPYQKFDTTVTNTAHYLPDINVTEELLTRFSSQLGRYGVWMNNSIANPINCRGATYERMWNFMIARRAQTSPFPIGLSFQTATINRMKDVLLDNGSTPYGTAAMVASSTWKSSGVEMPSGWTTDADPAYTVSLAQANALNDLFAANVAELITT